MAADWPMMTNVEWSLQYCTSPVHYYCPAPPANAAATVSCCRYQWLCKLIRRSTSLWSWTWFFFTFMLQDTSSATADNILSTCTGNTSTSLGDLHACTLLKNIFLELTTALPASAACERLFSVAWHVFVPNCTRMRDDHFEEQLLLRIKANL